jgi:hypothetical protein
MQGRKFAIFLAEKLIKIQIIRLLDFNFYGSLINVYELKLRFIYDSINKITSYIFNLGFTECLYSVKI